MIRRFIHKVVLVTGAGSGIGQAIAVRFAQEGAIVGINYHKNRDGAEKTLEMVFTQGSEGMMLQADVSVAREVDEMVSALIEKYGVIDVLVNNSGIGSPSSPDRVHEITEKDWDRVVEVNLKGYMLTAKAVLPHFIARKKGSIVNIASIRGLLGSPMLASYCASKGGVVLLTKAMALDYASHGIRVNCICPGFIETEMFRNYLSLQKDPHATRDKFAKMALINRIGQPEEIASVCAFLASDAASFITGVALPVDGGYTANGVKEI
ncbi:MAG: glucose 1-dehydrogenase [Atribacterota bacterium]